MTDAELLDRLSALNVARAWFARLDLPSGIWRAHSGVGTITIGGEDWRGITDPIGTVLVDIGQIEEPRFGSAVAVTITLSGANREFLQSVHASAREIEGRPAAIYWAAFDQETQEAIIELQPVFTRGRMTSPQIKYEGIGRRGVMLTIESIWSAQNFAPGDVWSHSGQQRRYPSDKGLSEVGQKRDEKWT